jgi:RNA polymerase sigma factor (sigma-70 family)
MQHSTQIIEELYQSHQQWLYQWLRKRTAHNAHASDLVQDTFVKVLQTRDAVFGLKEPRAYLLTIAKNLMLDQARRKRIEHAYLEELSNMQHVLFALPNTIEQQLEIVEAIEQISRALEQVSAKAQQAFLLHYFDGCTHKEIAQQLEVSTKTIQNYLAQCLMQCYQLQITLDEE